MQKIFNVIRNKPFKVFYNGLVPRNVRKRWNYQYDDKIKQEKVASYWRMVFDQYADKKIEKYDTPPIKKELVGKKIIWQYWGQGLENLPEMVEICFSSVDSHAHDYQVIRITDENINEYIKLPEFVDEKRKNGVFRPVFFSDLLRVALLSIYGGVWLDASVLLTDRLPKEYANCNFFMYSRDPNSLNKNWGTNDTHFYFNWRDEFKVKHLSSIMFSKPNSMITKTLVDLLLYYWENESKIEYYFFFQVMINELKESKIIDFEFPVIDDTFPHLLQSEIKKQFNEDEYKKIVSQASIHKLTIHEAFKEEYFEKQTYYGYLKNRYIYINKGAVVDKD